MEGRRGAVPVAVVAVVAVAVLLLAAPVVLALQVRLGGEAPHGAVLAVAGPAIVGQALADRADALPGEPFDGRAVGSARSARDSVRDGTADLAVSVDFRRTEDILFVPSTTAPALVADYRSLLGATSRSFGRTLGVREVVPVAGDDVGRRTPYVATAAAVLVGVVLAVLLSLWRGPVAATLARGALRLVGLAVVATVVGVVAAVVGTGGPSPAYAASVALLVAVTAWLVLALESVLGLAGLALAAPLLLALAAPLLAFVDPTALPAPWRQVLPWTPQGAGLDLALDLLHLGRSSVGAWAVLVAWGVLAVITLLTARRARPA